MRWSGALGFFILLLGIGRLFGQAQSGTIVGTVTDQAKAAMPGATVTLLNEDTHFQMTVKTNGEGQYVAATIPIGSYSITVDQSGFQKLVRGGIVLTVGDRLDVNLQLSLGNVQQTVTVEARAPLLQSQSSSVSTLVGNRQMVSLPLNGRTFTSLLLLAPGTSVGGASNLGSGDYSFRGSTNYTVNGSPPTNNSYFIDGLTDRGLWLSTLNLVPILDSIQEFRVITNNYSAEYGQAAGSITLVETKSGTNKVHGNAWEYLRNDAIDANDFFNNRAGVAAPEFRRNEFGFDTGGPIRRDKTFFFGDYQGLRIRQGQSAVSTIPTATVEQMVETGNFAQFGTTIYDPSSLQTVNGQLVRQPFAGNIIPAAGLDPAAVKIMKLLPVPTLPGATRNILDNSVLAQRTDQFDGRLDQNIGQSDRLYFKYSYDNSDIVKPGAIATPPNPIVPVGPYISIVGDSGTTEPLVNQSAELTFTKVISPTTVNEARVGVVRWNANITPLDLPYPAAQSVGIPGINISDKSGGLPAFTISGYQVIGDNNTFPEDSQTTTYQFEDNLTLVRGNHSIKMGGMLIRNDFNGYSSFPTRGTFDFNGQFTRQVGSSISTTSLSDFALGVPDTVTRNVLISTFGMRYSIYSGYAQDSWRATNRLTLDFGLRYDVFMPPYDVHNHFSNLNLNTGLVSVAGLNGNSRTLRNPDEENVGPHVGLAYKLTSEGKTVLRSGFGESYVEPGKGGGQLYKNPPYFISQVVNSDVNGLPPVRLSDGLPAPMVPNVNDEGALSQGSFNVWDYNMQSARMLQWSLGIQRQITPTAMVDVSYVGTRGLDLFTSYNYNQSFPGPGAQGPRYPMYAINPNIVTVTYNTNYGNSAYNSLQVSFRKAYSRNLQFTVAYTYSKYMSDGGYINGGGNGPPQNARCFRCEWGPTPDDYRHILVLNHIADLPFGPGQKFLRKGAVSHIVGGWQADGIWTVKSGAAFTPTMGTNVSNSAGGGGQRPNAVCNGNISNGTIDHWFNTNCFVAPLQYNFGNAAHGILTGPGLFNVDMGIHRRFYLSEDKWITLRGEFFNILNHPNFGIPNAVIGNATAGTISGLATADRIVQVSLRLTF